MPWPVFAAVQWDRSEPLDIAKVVIEAPLFPHSTVLVLCTTTALPRNKKLFWCHTGRFPEIYKCDIFLLYNIQNIDISTSSEHHEQTEKLIPQYVTVSEELIPQ